MVFIIGVLLGASLLMIPPITAVQSADLSKPELIETILRGYDKRFAPFDVNATHHGATTVTLSMTVRSIDKIDDVNMEYSVELIFRQEWKDERLAYRKYLHSESILYLSLPDSSNVWLPDTFFSNERSFRHHEMMKPNEYVRVYPDGVVLFSTRMSMTLSCPMNLKLYPMDKQTCSMKIASYGFTTDDLIYKWKKEDPVIVTPELHIPSYFLEEFRTDYCDTKTQTGVYSCVRVDFLFARELSHYGLILFIPTTMLVIISWLSFWLDHEAITPRVLVVILTLFVMVTQVSMYNSTLPKVSYTKSVDVWTGVCLTFAFSALWELVVVNYLARLELKQKQGNEHKSLVCDDGLGQSVKQALVPGLAAATLAEKIDFGARIWYPILFLLFNISYWSCYLMQPGK